MPRVSIRKIFIYLLAAASFGLVILNVHQNMVGHVSNNSPATWTGPSGPGASGASGASGSGQVIEPKKTENVPVDKSLSLHEQKYKQSTDRPGVIRRNFEGEPLKPDDLTIPDVSHRPYYVKDGTILPTQCPINPKSGERQARILPEEVDPGEDRVTNQLMFYPPKGSGPENMEDPDVPLKKIMLWNGVNSWGNTRPGRGLFIKSKCPVNSCAITSNRQEVKDADLVLFKDHFTMPTFQRPKDQLWMIYMLECPLHTQVFKSKDVFNWTATYR